MRDIAYVYICRPPAASGTGAALRFGLRSTSTSFARLTSSPAFGGSHYSGNDGIPRSPGLPLEHESFVRPKQLTNGRPRASGRAGE